MKETKISKENIECRDGNIKLAGDFYDGRDRIEAIMDNHKQICQRWLEFLDTYNFNELIDEFGDKLDRIQGKEFNKKIIDLKQAIKLYEDAGI